MTQYYESELIKEIVEARGHEKSSLHYESECIESWVEEVKGAYPKLCDYQSEWLSYINKIEGGGTEQPDPEPPIGEFPYVVISDVTEATVDNVVPYAYKSAILRGKTLVNLQPKGSSWEGNTGVMWYNESIPNSLFKPNTKYFLKFNSDLSNILESCYLGACGTEYNHKIYPSVSGCYAIMTTNEAPDDGLLHVYPKSGIELNSTTLNENVRFVFTEYQEGMENWGIPYFEDMQSVKMPVLTTTGKNLFNPLNFKNGELIEINGEKFFKFIDGPKPFEFTTDFETNKQYTITFSAKRDADDESKDIYLFVHYTDGTEEYRIIKGSGVESATLTTSANKTISKICGSYGFYKNVYINLNVSQLELGVSSSSFEPFKSNILTVNEPIELRGIGDVQDTLDCLTGEVTERIGEINTSSLNESHFIGYALEPSGLYRMTINVESLNVNGLIECDKLPVVPFMDSWDLPYECVALYNGGILLYLKDTPTVESFVNKAIGLDLIIQYVKSQNSIKTVDLNIQDQEGKTLSVIKPIEGKMFLSTSSSTIKPLFSGEIPVEAIAQNLSSFIDLEMEE